MSVLHKASEILSAGRDAVLFSRQLYSHLVGLETLPPNLCLNPIVFIQFDFYYFACVGIGFPPREPVGVNINFFQGIDPGISPSGFTVFWALAILFLLTVHSLFKEWRGTYHLLYLFPLLSW